MLDSAARSSICSASSVRFGDPALEENEESTFRIMHMYRQNATSLSPISRKTYAQTNPPMQKLCSILYAYVSRGSVAQSIDSSK
jgi:hypothetical protein